VAVKVFEGNTSDPATVADQVAALRDRFGLSHVILVGDRGMLTQARITEDLRSKPGIDWISALRAPAIQSLIEEGTIQPELFDTMDLAEVTSDEFPGERLVVCKNPFLAERRRLKREELLKATEKLLERIALATQRERNPLRGAAKIGVRLGRVLSKYKMGKHFTWDISDDTFSYQRDQQSIDQEALSDGLYVIRSTVPVAVMSEVELVGTYKSLSQVERAFRTMKTIDLKVRPIYHWQEKRVRAHVLLCMLAYYVEWHMRQSLAPILYQDNDKEQAQAERESIVAPASPSERAKMKAAEKRTEDNLPVFSFRTAIQYLSSIAMNWISFGLPNSPLITKITTPTPVQHRILDLLGVHV
jgi:transposase